MMAIYEPKGKALEYSPLAVNLYSGCAHRCSFCYAPAVLRKTKEEFGHDPRPRDGIVEAIKKDAVKLAAAHDTRQILLSFTSDPYQPIEADCQITRRSIEIMGQLGLNMAVLTKAGRLVERDFDLFTEYRVKLGFTLVGRDEQAREMEPGAGPPSERVEVLKRAKAAGIETWISLEPVFEAARACNWISELHPWVDFWKVGKINHDKKAEAAVDWSKFHHDVTVLLDQVGAHYMIKKDLQAYAR